ncbi:MAG: ATP-binding cassette domain-containing protein [Tissierellia bacterium]|nr:ATP-binding cassette domain-containing protein [Tissierellia bacterium]
MIKLQDVHAYYEDPFSRKKNYILKGIDLEIAPNQSIGIMGPSGSGKSTLAKIILKIMPISKGKYFYFDKDITFANPKAIKDFRAKIQYLPQSPGSYFDGSYLLKHSILEPLGNFNKSVDYDKLDELIEILQLRKNLLDRYPHQVSGGEIQRLSLLRILLLEPQLIILDEATSMLDISVQANILSLLKELREIKKLSYLIISHSFLLSEYMCDKIYVFKDGKLT